MHLNKMTLRILSLVDSLNGKCYVFGQNVDPDTVFVYILNKLAYIHISLNFTFIDLAGVI